MGKLNASFAQKVGKRIQNARKHVGLSQKDLASHLMVSDKAISSYEIGRTTPSFEVIGKISKIVHKPLSYFENQTDEQDTDIKEKIKIVEKELEEIKYILKKKV